MNGRCSLAMLLLGACTFLRFAGHAMAEPTRGLRVVARDRDGQAIPLYQSLHAVVIGVSRYKNLPHLPFAADESLRIERVLKNLGFAVTRLQDPTSAALKEALDRLTYETAGAEDAVLLYFAGHGYTEKLADDSMLGYILPIDTPQFEADRAAFVRTAISMREIETYVLRMKAKHVLCIIDSCFSGTIFLSGRSIPQCISEKTARRVRQFISAGDADEEVPDEGLFIETLEAAVEGAADFNRDGYLTGTELGMYLQDQVQNYSHGSQNPQYGKIRNAALDKGDFVFVLPAAGQTGAVPAAPAVAIPSTPPTIRVWRVGSPHMGDVPPTSVDPAFAETTRRAGYTLDVKSFAYAGFEETLLRAVAAGDPPDVLETENYGIVDRISSDARVADALITVSESMQDLVPSVKRGGWVFLLSTSKNHPLARALAMRSPENVTCRTSAGVAGLPAAESEAIRRAALAACHAYVTGNRAGMQKIVDPAFLGLPSLSAESTVAVANMDIVGLYGNGQLVFVPMAVVFEEPHAMGHRSLLLCLRKTAGGWALLLATNDPGAQNSGSLERLADTLSAGRIVSTAPQPAILLTADGVLPNKAEDLVWTTSVSPDVACEVVEFSLENQRSRLYVFTRVVPGSRQSIAAGSLRGSGGRWRVWSIGRGGDVAISESRTYNHAARKPMPGTAADKATVLASTDDAKRAADQMTTGGRATTRSPQPTQSVNANAARPAARSVVLPGGSLWDAESNGAKGNGAKADFWWEQASPTERYLVPRNGAQAAVVTGRTFESIDEGFVRAQKLSGRVEQKWGGKVETSDLSGSDGDAVLVPGAIIVFRTAEGNFGKLQVEGYRSTHDFSFPEAATLTREWKDYVLKGSETKRYHLQVKYVLFPPASSL